MALPAIHDPGTLTAGTSNTTHTSTPTSPLLSLPREIRDDICAYLISAGDLAILCTSKQIHDEARECLYREGVRRINIGLSFLGSDDDTFLSSDGWESCQNFYIRIYFGPGNSLPHYPKFWQFELFDDLYETDRKRKGIITIDYGAYDPGAPFHLNLLGMDNLLEQISHLTSFTMVVVMLAPKRSEQWKYNKNVCDLLDRESTIDRWGDLKGRLEPHLGPAKLVGDTDEEDQRLVFHPRGFRGSLARRQGGSES